MTIANIFEAMYASLIVPIKKQKQFLQEDQIDAVNTKKILEES